MNGDLPDWNTSLGIGITALMTATGRALETNKTDGLISDPYAEYFVKAAHLTVPLPTRPDDESICADVDPSWMDRATTVGARSRYFDDYCYAAAATGIRQVVLVAAGLDTRAFRLDWPNSCTIFEIDQVDVMRFKHKVLDELNAQRRCDRFEIVADLRGDWTDSLLQSGFSVVQPTAWLAEGLWPYLEPQEQRRLMHEISRLSAPGSQLALDHIDTNDDFLACYQEVATDSDPNYIELFAAHNGTNPSELLLNQGWDIESIDLASLLRQYSRDLGSSQITSIIKRSYHFHTAILAARTANVSNGL